LPWETAQAFLQAIDRTTPSGIRDYTPLTVFDTKGVPYARRERIEQAVVAGGKHLREPYEGWIATDPRRGGVRLTITGANGFDRTVVFAADEEPATIPEMVRATLDE
jgi:hypothetical protein